MNDNILLATDSYKASHYLQLPPKTTQMQSYVEARGGKFEETLYFGLQIFLKELVKKRITQDNIEEASDFWTAHGLPFNKIDWIEIFKSYGGHLPLAINAVAEGSVIPISNCLLTVENTDPRFPWLTSFIETTLLRAIWYPTTVSSNSFHMKKTIKKYLDETSDFTTEDQVGMLSFMLHDFGARGVSSAESAAIGGAAHLVNFMGSDTVEGILAAREYYGEPMAGFSIPAAEHSTITSWGRENEAAAFKNMLDQFGDGALVAVVSDSYDIYNACEHLWGEQLKQQVLDMPARLVVRPDSGYPPDIDLAVLTLLGDKFGYTTNNKGYKVLNPAVRVIQGDGIDAKMLVDILENLKSTGWAAENMAFGCGGGLLQKLDRDTCMFALKTSWAMIDGEGVDIYKDPVTMSAKKSKRGRLSLVKTAEGGYKTVNNLAAGEVSILEPKYLNGELLNEITFEQVRANAACSL